MRAQALGAGLVAPSPSSLPPFALHRPSTLAEAASVLTEHPDAVVAAGCTDLVAQLREGRAPTRVVSVRRTAELQQVQETAGMLRLGAGLTHHRGSTDPLLRKRIPSLAAAWASIATVRIRHSATVGGNLLARRHRYEMPVILGALDAELEFVSSPTQRRPITWLWESEAWQPQGLLTSVAVPTTDLIWFGYERSMRPLTTVAAAVRRAPDGSARINATVGSEYHHPVTLTADVAPDALVGVATEMARSLPASVTDVAGSAEYRRHVVGVLLRRLLTTAHEEVTS